MGIVFPSLSRKPNKIKKNREKLRALRKNNGVKVIRTIKIKIEIKKKV